MFEYKTFNFEPVPMSQTQTSLLRVKAFFDPYNASVLNNLAVSYSGEGLYKEACYYFDLATKLGGIEAVDCDAYLFALQKRKRWRKIIGICNKVYARGKCDKADILYKIGYSYAQLKQLADASIYYKKSLHAQDSATDFDFQLLENDSERFFARQYVLHFLKKAMGDIIVQKNQLLNLVDNGLLCPDFRVFMYWGQGFENAPEIVKACVDKNIRTNGDRIVLLSDANLAEWIDIPDSLFQGKNISKAHFSDFLRLLVLSKYGGVWADATCFLKGDLETFFSENSIHEFFVYKKNAFQISSWFIASTRSSYLLNMMLASIIVYWREHDEAVDYFFFHHLFESLLLLDSEFKSCFDSMPSISRSASLKMARVLGESYSEDKVGMILKNAFVHKLTHKYHRKYRDQDFGENSLLFKLFRGDV